VAHDAYEPQQIRQLADALGIPGPEHDAFRAALDELVESKQLIMGASNTIALPPIGREVTGKFKKHERGFGFIIPDTPTSHGDVFVAPGDGGDAMTGDRVRADIVHRSGRGGRSRSSRAISGRITEVIQRGSTRFTGNVAKQGDLWLVWTDGKAMADPIVVRDAKSKNVRIGDKVVVELTVYPEGRQLPEGVITEVLGDAGKPDVETEATKRAFGLADEFPDEVVAEARDVTQDYNDHTEAYAEGRVDLRDTFTVTIDPPDAKDFDDAITIERTSRGWKLGVHIADVATFVRPDSALDLEARERGNSAYLPRHVVPMLPEVLSNGICSLQPQVPRLVKTAFIEYDGSAKITNTAFANAIIESNHRLTYLEAQALIDGDRELAKKHQVYDLPYSDELVEAVQMLDELAKVIRKRRYADGMISLDLPEVELVFDDEGHVIDANPEDDAFTHQIIEAFMVEANEAVAAVFADLDVPLLRRIHPDPSTHDTDELRRFARVAGYNVPSNPSRKELQAVLEATRGKPAAKAVHLAVLKTLTKAEYSPQLIGHFALASEHYAHFTSPIRRYPDLTVHRSLEALLEVMGDAKSLPRGSKARQQIGKKLLSDERCPDEEKLIEVGRHCSGTERNAEEAERQLRNFLVLQLMEQHIGDHFMGTITGVVSFGVFVQIDQYLVEGLIGTDNLPGAPAERWKLNEQTGSMVAQRSGRSLTIGDQLKVQIMAVDLAKRELDLRIEDDGKVAKQAKRPPKSEPRRKGGGGPAKKQRKGKGNRGRR
jgi:ribonuclease R